MYGNAEALRDHVAPPQPVAAYPLRSAMPVPETFDSFDVDMDMDLDGAALTVSVVDPDIGPGFQFEDELGDLEL